MGVEPGAAASREQVAATELDEAGTTTTRESDDGDDARTEASDAGTEASEGRTGASDAHDETPYEEPRGTALDSWWARVLSTPRRRALWYWGGPVLVTLIAAVLRFWNLGHPQSIVFDETYYVKDAWTLLQN